MLINLSYFNLSDETVEELIVLFCLFVCFVFVCLFGVFLLGGGCLFSLIVFKTYLKHQLNVYFLLGCKLLANVSNLLFPTPPSKLSK